MAISPLVLSLADVGRLGVIWGGAGFSNRVATKIQESGLDYKSFAWMPHTQHGHWLPMWDPHECVKILKEEQIRSVVHVGSINHYQLVSKFVLAIRGNPHSLAKTLASAWSPSETFFQPYATQLQAADIQPVSIRHLFEGFAPMLGPMGEMRPSSKERAWLVDLKNRAKEELTGHQIFGGVAQAIVYDDDRVVGIDRRGTDILLDGLRRPGGRRVLMKVSPFNLPPNLYPPTIGSNTVRKARAAGVDIIALESGTGVVVDLEETVSAANGAGIILFGV